MKAAVNDYGTAERWGAAGLRRECAGAMPSAAQLTAVFTRLDLRLERSRRRKLLKEACTGRHDPQLERALLLCSELMALLDECERFRVNRNGCVVEAGFSSGHSIFGEEIVVGSLEGSSAILGVEALPGGTDCGYFAHPEGVCNALKSSEKQCGGGNVVQGPGGKTDLGIASLDALNASNQQALCGVGIDHCAGDDGEGENINNFPIHAQVKRELAFFIVRSGKAHRQGKTAGAVRDFINCNFLLQCPAQEVIGQSPMQAPVVMKKAGGAFWHGKALGQVARGEVFDGKAGVAEDNLSERRKLDEEAEHFAVRSDVGEAAPEDAPEPRRRRRLLWLRGDLKSFGERTVFRSGAIFDFRRAMDSHRHLAVEPRCNRLSPELAKVFATDRTFAPERGAGDSTVTIYYRR